MNATENAHVRIIESRVLADDWGVLRRNEIELRGADGTWRRQPRETYDRGNGAAILLYEPDQGTVLLVRQFRYPAFVNGHPDGMLLEVPAGLLDGDDAESAIRREAEEETGVRVGEVRRVFELFMSPGSVTERLVFFAAPYRAGARAGTAGVAEEGEETEVVELALQDALAAIERGEIVDGKTVLLLQWAQRERPC
jgi:nudix-type nucleoside diphosphatase (YffH/AdpP family)